MGKRRKRRPVVRITEYFDTSAYPGSPQAEPDNRQETRTLTAEAVEEMLKKQLVEMEKKAKKWRWISVFVVPVVVLVLEHLLIPWMKAMFFPF